MIKLENKSSNGEKEGARIIQLSAQVKDLKAALVLKELQMRGWFNAEKLTFENNGRLIRENKKYRRLLRLALSKIKRLNRVK